MKYVKLGDICSKGVSSLRQKDTLPVGDYPVYGASGICGYLSDYQHNEPYVAVVKDGAGVGRVQLCSGKSSVLGTLQALLPKEEVNCEYLYEVVRSLNLGDGFTGSTIPHIYFKDYKNRTVVIYEKEQQTKITVLFSAVKNLIELHKLAISTYDKLVKSRFIEMFGDPISSNIWPMKQLEELYSVGSSKRIYTKDQTKEGVPFYRLADVGCLADGLNPSNDLFISEGRFAELKKAGYVPGVNDILVTARGTLGKCYIVCKGDKFYFQDGMITWLRQTETSPQSGYLVALFSNDHFLKSLNDLCSGTTVKYLSISDLAKMRIPIPPSDLQDAFLFFAAQVDKLEFDFDFLVSFNIPSICLLCLELDP